MNTASEMDYTSTEIETNIVKLSPKNQCNVCNEICSDDLCVKCFRQKAESYIVAENVIEVTEEGNSETKDNKALPIEYERFIVQYNKTGIRYMQCDKCQFICRPLVNIFEKHYRSHFEEVSEEKPEIEEVDSKSEPIACKLCDETFPSRGAYLTHTKTHKTKSFSCNVCGMKFRNKFFLKVHSKSHPTQKPTFLCNLCGKTFKTKSGYTHHRSNVCVQYTCEICNDVFLVKSVLQDHLKKVHDIKEDVKVVDETPKKEQSTSVCPICGKIVTENALTRHMYLHSEDKPYICDLCGKHFRIKWSLREHIMIEIGMKDYVCEICGKKFVIQAYLNKHMRFHMMCEGKFEGYQCEICGKKYAEEWKVKEHQRNSHKGKNLLRYKCDICDKKYTRKWLVRSHKRTAHKDHLEEYHCNFCDKKFSEKWIIKLHFQTVHNVNNENGSNVDIKATSDELEKLLEYNQRISCDGANQLKAEFTTENSRKKSFECELCGKMFATKQGMKNHLYAELNLRKYVCEICGKRYNWWMGLKEHSIMNHGEKEFFCDFCGKDFPTKKRCKDHLSVHSNDRPYNCKCGNSFKLRRYLAKHQKRCGKVVKKDNICDSIHQSSEQVSKSVNDPRIPEEFRRFLRVHTNQLKYMQCDKCSFICRPLMSLFLKHYKIHSKFDEQFSSISNLPVDNAEDPLDSSKSKFECLKCHKVFDERKNFCRHLKIHDKKIFLCTKCDCKFKSKLAFISHKRIHNRKKHMFFCDQCGKYFKSKDGYKYHKENACILSKCDVCDETFHKKAILYEHLKVKHDILICDTEEEKRLEAQTSMCFICGKIVKNINLERHMMVHTEEKPFVCELCGKRFKFKNAIRDHIMIKLGMKDYVCEICGRKFVKKCYLNKHIRLHFSRKEDHKLLHCDVCGKKFFDRKLLSAHRRTSHDNDKPFACDLCEKAYNSKECLRQHLLREVICLLCDEIFISNDVLRQHIMSVHELDKYREIAKEKGMKAAFVYPCDICGRRFTSEDRFHQHLNTEVLCELCNTRFTSNEELKGHIETVHDLSEYRKIISLRWRKKIKSGDSESIEYSCKICGKKLFYKRTLSLHMRMHSGLKPYKCEYCNKAYTSKHALNAHLVSEMNLRKFVCSYCGKRYNFNSDLIVHVKQRHESKQFSCHVCGKEFGLLKYLKDHSTIHSQIKPFNCDKCKIGFRLRKFLLRHKKKYHAEDDLQLFDVEVVTDE